MYENIISVIPGEIIYIDLNNLVITRRDNFTPNSILNSKNLSISSVIVDSLVNRVEGHKNFALSLSGGIDSSILALECSKLGLNVETYSMAWENSDKNRYQLDSRAANKIAKALNLKHKIIEMPKPDKLDEILDLYVRAMGEPNSNPTGLSMMILYSEIAKDNHRLVLTGDGADEIFGGYKRYQLANTARLFPKFNPTGKILTKNLRNKYLRMILLSTSYTNSDNFWLYWHTIAHNDIINTLLPNLPNVPQKIYGSELSKIYSNSYNNASSLMFRDLRTWLPMESNRKLDRISMWFSIEARSPFESENVIGVGYKEMSTSNFLKIKKQKLLEAYPDLQNLPVLTSKSGFVSPLGYWLRNNPSLIRNSLENITEYLPFNKKQLLTLSSAANDGNFSNFKLLWSIIVLNRWFEVNN
jgi:asparagine synthase (glutamine-hydrolysing)